MGISDKSKHVGNHGGVYTDIDGQTKQFTVIDHDKKTKIASGISEKVDNTFFTEYQKDLVQRILKVPADLCPIEFRDFCIQGESISWNQNMLTDTGIGIDKLRTLTVQLENKQSLSKLLP